MINRNNWMIGIYNGVMTLIVPFLLLFFYLCSYFKDYKYRSGLLERIGLYSAGINYCCQNGVWVHIASIGELMAVSSLLKCISGSILITCFTPAGKEQAIKMFPKAKVLFLPLDVRISIKRFLNKFNPRVGIIVETEVWPNLINEVKKRGIPLFLVNARLSDRSVRRYCYFRKLFVPIFGYFTKILVQSFLDKERFEKLRIDNSKIILTGNLKFDFQINSEIKQEICILKKCLSNRVVFIAASTHEKEEEIILESFKVVRRSYPNLLLFLVPRHRERFEKVFSLASKSFKTQKFSEWNYATFLSDDISVLLGDVLGKLLVFYGGSNFALVGGSLIPVGGHNLLEPVAFKLPVITGPYLVNCQEISEQLLKNKGLLIVRNRDELTEQVLSILKNKEYGNLVAERGYEVLKRHYGAVDRTLVEIRKITDC